MASDAVFNQVDLNKDGRVDLGEFRNFLGQNLGAGAGYGAGSSWESSSYGAGAGLGGGAGWSESSSFETGASGAAFGGAYDASYAVGGGLAGGAASYESIAGSAGYAGDAAIVAGGAAFDSSAVAASQVHYATDAQGLFQDPNPQIIRRPAPGGVQTYTQNIRVRFLQPPPVPPPGPLIIREVRPPQPPVPPPLRLRQVAPPLPTPPPLVLRERPPVPPPVVASQTVVRRLAAIPVPPRSVIIERLPAAPPRPRDIIIERWVPYGAQAKRRTILQRAGAAIQYPAPRNVIIQYEQAPARIVRQFQRLGVVAASPAAYVQTYGAQLLDAAALLSQARAAGVVEDISAPGFVGYSGAAIGQESWSASSGLVGGGALATGGVEVVDSGLALGGGLSSSSFESSSFSSGGAGGWEGGLVGGGGYGGSWGSSGLVGGGISGGDAAFLNADTNLNGSLDQGEFRQFLAQNL
ncbi:unnamed protein product [Rotaria sp. Silwood2]|nr:unnamed protein product [Rotaria sp. Silwood2]CAF2845539.1 unnamed protein product [Rotaria sp. Silwood2]CAF3205679.1 unnamed protein product [Rotaria sp. Silwood2]CAF3291133.1 unnamed protein product [Rotaria sp. Silwood2]CAF3883481.1 unnamed protein product [Rotaria sp. Silwood2]